jgi:hypothetical protein
MLGLLDDRSTYGTFWFPEPLLGPEMDVDREVRLDYFHTQGPGNRADEWTIELEYAIGQLTLEVEVPYERQTEDGSVTEGVGSVELAARHPIFEYVAADNAWDYTLVAGLEVAIPTETDVSRGREVVPKLGQLLRLGKNISLQSTVGYSIVSGSDEGGTETLEYSATLGYDLNRDAVCLPGIDHLIPLLEVSGSYVVHGTDKGLNEVFGVVGARADMSHTGWLPAQFRPGIGFAFPLDEGARRDHDWGIVLSFVFEY